MKYAVAYICVTSLVAFLIGLFLGAIRGDYAGGTFFVALGCFNFLLYTDIKAEAQKV